LIEIYIDADACPVKDEIYAVASRHQLYVTVVANTRINVPSGVGAEMVVVEDGPDAADDWIAEHIRAGDIAITADIPLAARCLAVGAYALGTNGRPFDEDSIGGALATREIKSQLREAGVASGGPPPMSSKDRARFSSALDTIVQRSLRDSARSDGTR
jgi:uncharacterized protein YaiI (UPF0178 family)